MLAMQKVTYLLGFARTGHYHIWRIVTVALDKGLRATTE